MIAGLKALFYVLSGLFCKVNNYCLNKNKSTLAQGQEEIFNIFKGNIWLKYSNQETKNCKNNKCLKGC